MSFTIFTSPPAELRVDGGRLTNYGPDVVYYRDEFPVSSSVNDGSLAAGASATLDGSVWLVSAGRSSVGVIAAPVSAQSGSGLPDGGPGVLTRETEDGAAAWVETVELGQVLPGACLFADGDWTFGGVTISARPAWSGPLFWMGGAAADSPEAWMLAGDVWYAESE